MLAEIFFLRLETLLRASPEPVRVQEPVRDSRFIPLAALPLRVPANGRARASI